VKTNVATPASRPHMATAAADAAMAHAARGRTNNVVAMAKAAEEAAASVAVGRARRSATRPDRSKRQRALPEPPAKAPAAAGRRPQT